MGNKITSTRVYVDEKYTRPQGLYDPSDADYRKLRRLILNGQLAPCFPGVEECAFELDECPICFLFYPSLNRSRCCSKAICTECYLQVKSVHFARSTQCPFCKTSGYTVEFRGARTAEEKGVEQAEEQKVIEAKIRMRQKELRDEAERVLRLETDTQAEPFEHEINLMSMEPDMSPQADHVQRSLSGLSRSDSLDLEMEDWMLMEAIWLSIQEQGQMHQEFDLARHISPTSGMSETGFLGSGGSDQVRTRIAGRAGGLTRAMADHAERQGTGGDNRAGDRVVDSSRNLLQSDTNLNATCTDMPSFECSDLAARCCPIDASHRGMGANRDLQKEKQDVPWEKPQNGERSRQDARCDTAERNGWLNSVWSSVRREGGGYTSDLGFEQSSTGAMEAGTSFSSSRPSAAELPWEAPDFRSSQSSDAAGETSLSSASGSMSFEDQITLAMALSLADAQAQARKAWYEQLN